MPIIHMPIVRMPIVRMPIVLAPYYIFSVCLYKVETIYIRMFFINMCINTFYHTICSFCTLLLVYIYIYIFTFTFIRNLHRKNETHICFLLRCREFYRAILFTIYVYVYCNPKQLTIPKILFVFMNFIQEQTISTTLYQECFCKLF